MAGDMVGDLAERSLEVGFQQSIPLPQYQVFKRIEHCFRHCMHILVCRKHERQFLFN
jgi:hypothetical protein